MVGFFYKLVARVPTTIFRAKSEVFGVVYFVLCRIRLKKVLTAKLMGNYVNNVYLFNINEWPRVQCLSSGLASLGMSVRSEWKVPFLTQNMMRLDNSK